MRCLEFKLPSGGINRIRFLGCLSTGNSPVPPLVMLNKNYFLISSSLISYKRFQFFPVR